MFSEIFDKVRFKPACSATEDNQNPETLSIAIHIILSKQWTTTVLVRLRGCAGWSAPLLFAYDIWHIFAWLGPYGDINGNVKQCRPWTDCFWRNNLIWVYTICPDLPVGKLRIVIILKWFMTVLCQMLLLYLPQELLKHVAFNIKIWWLIYQTSLTDWQNEAKVIS